MKKEEALIVQRSYSKIARKYHEQRIIYKNNTLLKKVMKYLPKDSRILDLGCGAGEPVAKILANSGYKVTGIDFAAGMVKLAKKQVPKAKFIKMDMTKLKFKDNSFDAAVSFYAIIHVPREKHAKIYKQLHKILKSGGILFVNCSGPDSWEGFEKNYLGVPMFWSFYAPKKTRGIIKKAGFKILWSKVLAIGGEKQYWVLAKNKK
jgi:ubiquinone/menaquinone biosynthesis C-methylase UbiE